MRALGVASHRGDDRLGRRLIGPPTTGRLIAPVTNELSVEEGILRE